MNKKRDADGYYVGIINPYNGHNRDLVDKICDAWDNPKYHDLFGIILFAIACRDQEEICEKLGTTILRGSVAMEYAHEIMENICDDLDLECILKFIRYE